jgi:Na+/serine symporter
VYLSFSPELVVFLLGTFAAAFVTGLAGFAFGMVAAKHLAFRSAASADDHVDRRICIVGARLCDVAAA